MRLHQELLDLRELTEAELDLSGGALVGALLCRRLGQLDHSPRLALVGVDVGRRLLRVPCPVLGEGGQVEQRRIERRQIGEQVVGRRHELLPRRRADRVHRRRRGRLERRQVEHHRLRLVRNRRDRREGIGLQLANVRDRLRHHGLPLSPRGERERRHCVTRVGLQLRSIRLLRRLGGQRLHLEQHRRHGEGDGGELRGVELKLGLRAGLRRRRHLRARLREDHLRIGRLRPLELGEVHHVVSDGELDASSAACSPCALLGPVTEAASAIIAP